MTISPVVQIVGIIAVILGWIVTNSQSNKRETRKEGRAACDSIKEYVLQASIKGREYYSTRTEELAFDTKSELELLEIELSRIPYFGVGENSTLMSRYVDFSNALTDGDFEQKDAPKYTATDKKMQRIIRVRNVLLREVERQFKLQFL